MSENWNEPFGKIASAFKAAGSITVYYEVTRLNQPAQAPATGSFSTDIPAAGAFLALAPSRSTRGDRADCVGELDRGRGDLRDRAPRLPARVDVDRRKRQRALYL